MTEIFRHANGGGKIHGIAGSISSDSLLDLTSEVHGKTFVSFMSEIRKSSIVHNSSLSCAALNGSFVADSQVTYALLTTSWLNNAVVRGTRDPARLENMILEGVTVEGCRLRNFELSGAYLLHSDWDRQPRHFDLKEFGIPLHVIECRCRPGVMSGIIGCKCRTLTEWIENREFSKRLFAKRFKWQPAVIDLIHAHFRDWLRVPSL